MADSSLALQGRTRSVLIGLHKKALQNGLRLERSREENHKL